MILSRAQVILSLLIPFLLGVPSTCTGRLSEGVGKYLRRQDGAAISKLREEISLGDESPFSRLALSDLYVIHGDLESARKILSGTLAHSRGQSTTQPEIWLAWVEYLDKGYAKSERILEEIIRTSASAETGLEALATLSWQQLLLGKNEAAAKTLGQLTDAGSPSDHWYLLAGEALMWSGQLGAATDRFRELTDRFSGSTLADDAERDIAWCEYLDGNVEGAIGRLKNVIAEYDRPPYRHRNVLQVRWPLVARRGPVILRDKMWRAYKVRPRGQFPLAFLLTVTDRFAVPDARQLLAYIDKETDDKETHRELSPEVKLPAGVTRVEAAASAEISEGSERTTAARAKKSSGIMAGFLSLLVVLLLLVLLIMARAVRLGKSQSGRRHALVPLLCLVSALLGCGDGGDHGGGVTSMELNLLQSSCIAQDIATSGLAWECWGPCIAAPCDKPVVHLSGDIDTITMPHWWWEQG